MPLRPAAPNRLQAGFAYQPPVSNRRRACSQENQIAGKSSKALKNRFPSYC